MHLQHRDVGRGVGADDARLHVVAVREADLHRLRAFDHVVVRDDVAGLVDHEAGAERLLLLLSAARTDCRRSGSCGTLTTLVEVICTTPDDQRSVDLVDRERLAPPRTRPGALDEEVTIRATVVSRAELAEGACAAERRGTADDRGRDDGQHRDDGLLPPGRTARACCSRQRAKGPVVRVLSNVQCVSSSCSIPDVVFLNHGSFGACPRPVFAEYQRLQLELEREPVEFLSLKRRFPELIGAARERLAAYVGASACRPGARPERDDGGERGRALARPPARRRGRLDDARVRRQRPALAIHVRASRRAPTSRSTRRPRAPWTNCSARSRRARARCSSATSRLRPRFAFPLEELCARARDAGVLTIVDGAHAPGQIALDVGAVGADFYAGNCHKWLCAPKGAGFLHVACRGAAAARAARPSAGTGRLTSGPTASAGPVRAIRRRTSRCRPRSTSRPSTTGMRCARAVTRLPRGRARARRQLGMEPSCRERRRVRADGRRCGCRRATRKPWACGSFRERRIEVLAQTWRGEPTLRVSFQGYNDENDLDALVEALSDLLY